MYIAIPKKGEAKGYSNYRTITLVSHARKVMLMVLQQRLLPYIEKERPDAQDGF